MSRPDWYEDEHGVRRRLSDNQPRRGEKLRLARIHLAASYDEASAGGTVPAEARQLGYAFRRLSGLGDDVTIEYVTTSPANESLLDLYIAEHPEAAAWDVVRKARGAFVQPNGETIPLGTIAVRNHILDINRTVSTDLPRRLTVPTGLPRFGPGDDYSSVLYIEKAGFNTLLNARGVPRAYNLGIASSEGFSVDAARALLVYLSEQRDLPVFVAHDFDASGIGIAKTIEREVAEVVDLGLRWDDIERFDADGELDLMSERVTFTDRDPRSTLADHGATDEEIDFLCEHWDPVTKTGHGRRVELNALVGQRFVDWLTGKLDDLGLDTRPIPGDDILEAQYRRQWAADRLNEMVREAWSTLAGVAATIAVPDDLRSEVSSRLDDPDDLAVTWRQAIADLVDEEDQP